MPTYRNDSAETRHEYNIDDQFVQVAPGGSIQTYLLLGAGWTKTADTPTKITFSNVLSIGASSTSWIPIILPIGIKATSVMIQLHNGSPTDFTTYKTDPPLFHYSTLGDASTAFTQCVGSLSIDILDGASPSLGYVRAATGLYFVLLIVK